MLRLPTIRDRFAEIAADARIARWRRSRWRSVLCVSSWTKIFTDPRLCAAIVDRSTFAGQIIETGSTSYRLAHARTIKPPPKAPAATARRNR